VQDGPNDFAAEGGLAGDPPDAALSHDRAGLDDDLEHAVVGGRTKERRRHRRARVLWGGILSAQQFRGDVACTVSDISAGGAKLLVPAWPEGSDADVLDNLDVGHKVRLSLRASGEVLGEIVWQKPGRIGVRFLLQPDEVRQRFEGVVPND